MTSKDFDVEVKQSIGSVKHGYDLTVWRHGHGWTTSDLTTSQLRAIRNEIDRFLDGEKSSGRTHH
jgi:hypothetical protein